MTGPNKTDCVPDFRLTTRTFYLNNPVVRNWYWQMNYHIEHHMYRPAACLRHELELTLSSLSCLLIVNAPNGYSQRDPWWVVVPYGFVVKALHA